jgi:hypothetical protein
LTSAVTTRVPVPGNNCAVPPTETNFLTTDNRVWIVFSYTGGSAGDTDFVEWFDPSGNLYVTSTFQQAVSGGTNCLGYYIGISGFAPASQPGNWRVRLRSNNTEVFSRPFTISAPTASTLALASNTTLPQATVGAPYTFSFTASGGTAPYKWSLSSGQTPPGLTLSTAGVLSGTATSAASYVLALHVADSAGNSLDRDIGLGVSLPALQIGVGSLAFSFTQNGTAPKSQTFSLASNGAALPFTLKTDQNWLSATPASGSTPGTVTVSVQPQGLTPGSYQGNVTVQSSASSTSSQTVAVNLAVFPPGTGTPGGVIRTFAGTDFTFSIAGGKALNAPLGQVYGLAMDSSGNVYAPDYQNHVVVKIAPNGTASVIAGNGLQGFSGDGAAAVNASLNGPGAVGIDKAGNLYIADTFNNRIRRVSPDGTITTIAGSSTFGFAGDNGPAVNALLFFPSALVADPAGNVYFSDFGNARIRKIDGSTGRITTIAGNGKTSYSGEGAATSVSAYVFNQMAVDSLGNLYFSDLEHHVRKLTTSGQTVLIAGNGQGGFSGENVAATGAALNVPAGLAVDSGGRVFIADFNNGRIRSDHHVCRFGEHDPDVGG